MKNICIITGTFNEHIILTPLMNEIKKDPCLYLTVISSGRHTTPEFDLTYIRQEEEGFTIDEKTNIVFNTKKIRSSGSSHFPQPEYDRILKSLQPDIVLLAGSRFETFAAAVTASQNNIPIAHIQGGESDFGTWDDSYGYGVTKLSHLHFTSTETYRRQVIRFGEQPQSVYNVGSLLIEKIKSLPLRGKALFHTDFGFDKNDLFIFVCFHPEASLGSKNECVFQEVLESLTDKRFKKFKLLINKPEPTGLGKIIIQMIDTFTLKHSDRTVSVSSMNLPDLGRAVKYCSALVGNSSKGIAIASSFKTPVIYIGEKMQKRIIAPNMIECHPKKEEILCAVQNGLSTAFKKSTMDMRSPFEQILTAKKIKGIIKKFSRKDIASKTLYSPGLNVEGS